MPESNWGRRKSAGQDFHPGTHGQDFESVTRKPLVTFERTVERQ